MFLQGLNINIGFICSTYKARLSTNHTLRFKNLRRENLLNCVRKNLEDLLKLLQLSNSLGCKIFRLGSEFVPFASHPNFKKEWLREVEVMIREYLPEIKKFDIRITMHPGQYVILSSRNSEILKRSLAELKYHFWVLEKLMIDENGIVVIHGGGKYFSKEDSLKTLINNIHKHSWLRERLALENDEKIYHARDILKVCQETKLPFVFDYFHHQIHPSEISLKEILETWGKRIPEFHLSSSQNASFRHGDYIKKEDFLNLVFWIKREFFHKEGRIDILLEAKKKELAIKKLLSEIKRNHHLV